MLTDYRPTKEDLATAEGIACREFLPHDHADRGSPPSEAEMDFINIVREAWRIGDETQAATIGEAWDSLIGQAQRVLDKRLKHGLSGNEFYEHELEYLKENRP